MQFLSQRICPAFLLWVLITLTAAAQSAWTDKTRVLPDKLRRQEDGISLWHGPNPCHPQQNLGEPGKYVWKHSTSVQNRQKGPLRVLEGGSFIWYNAEGWQANIQLSPAEFAEAFGCPGGVLKPGHTYTFRKNYRYADRYSLYGGDALWYVLAKDARGRIFRGMGLVETESDTLAPAKPAAIKPSR